MKNYFMLTAGLLFFGLLTSTSHLAQAQTYKTVALTAASFTADIIANGSAASAPTNSTTADVDGAGYYFISQDYYTASIPHTSGISNDGAVQNTIVGPSTLTYQLASLSANNSLRLASTASGTITFATPTAAKELYVLGASGSGISTVNITVNYSDGTSSSFTGQTYPDWFTTSATQNVFGTSGRASNGTTISVTLANNGTPFLDQVKLTVPTAKQGTTITGITFAKTSTGAVLNIMAVSIAAATPLPVQLVTFTARRTTSTAVALTWATASEAQNAGFAVERSADGAAWAKLTFVPGLGTSAQAHPYTYTDVSAPSGPLYYRLRQLDQDGATTYSPVRAVTGWIDNSLSFSIYPNPAPCGLVQLQNTDPTAPVRVMTAQGQLLEELPAGTTSLDTHRLPAGLYLLRSGQASQRLLVP